MPMKILIATDGSRRSEKAASKAIEMAQSCSGSLNIISVVDAGSPRSAIDIDPYDIEDESILKELDEKKKKPEEAFVERISNMAAESDVKAGTEVRIGDPADEILDYAKETASDVIVIGSHGRGAVASAVMGSTSLNLVRKGNVPVLVVPARED
ncbi:MAG: universal stress protein [Thermoleophilia bacterium]|nr:universal stress protein [Thermoleophilia bacterium]